MVKENVMVQTEIGLIPEDWTVRKLREVISYISYGFTNPMPTTNEGIWMVTANDVKNGEINFSTARRTSIDAFNKFLTEKSKPKQNDLLLTKDGTLGRVAVVHNDLICINQSVAVIRTNKYLNVFFLKHLLQDSFYQKVMIENAGGSTIKHIYITVVDKMPIVVPSLHEQQAIAEALSDADEWIESLEKLIAKKRLIKHGAMQELLEPKEDWEMKKLGEILKFGSGKDYKHLNSGDIPVYGTGGIMTFVDNYLYDGLSIGIGRKGTIDKPVLLSGKFWTVDTLFFTHSFIGVDPTYIYYQFLLIAWREYNEASGVPSLNKNTLEQIEIKIPSLVEQTRISTILFDMDLELKALAAQLEKARKIKHGMMQELLTGRIRLV